MGGGCSTVEGARGYSKALNVAELNPAHRHPTSPLVLHPTRTGCGRETASETAVPATRESRETRAARVRESGEVACALSKCARRAAPRDDPRSCVLDTLVSCIRVAQHTKKLCRYDALLPER